MGHSLKVTLGRRAILRLLSLVLSVVASHGSAIGQQPLEQIGARAIPTLCPEWLKDEHRVVIAENPCQGYTSEYLNRVKFLVNEEVGGWKWCPDRASKVFPGPPIADRKEIERRGITDTSGKLVGRISLEPHQGDNYYRTWSTPYQLPMGWIYHFDLHRVPKSEQQRVLKSLQSIERTILFGRFEKTNSSRLTDDGLRPVRLPFFIESDNFARYGRVIDMADPAVREGFYTPLHWAEGLNNESLNKLWAECAIPIDSDWLPTGQPLRTVVPIAIQTSADLYLVSQEVRPQQGYGGTLDHFEGRVIDLSGSRDLEIAFKRVAESLRAELTASFTEPPLLADPVQGLAPNQVRFTRRFQESQVLSIKGDRKYELSTYTVLIWPGPKDNFLGTAEGYFGFKAELDKAKQDQVFLQVNHSLQVSTEREGTYPEPSSDDYVAYKAAVSQAIEKSVERVVAKYHGTMSNVVGKVLIGD